MVEHKVQEWRFNCPSMNEFAMPRNWHLAGYTVCTVWQCFSSASERIKFEFSIFEGLRWAFRSVKSYILFAAAVRMRINHFLSEKYGYEFGYTYYFAIVKDSKSKSLIYLSLFRANMPLWYTFKNETNQKKNAHKFCEKRIFKGKRRKKCAAADKLK